MKVLNFKTINGPSVYHHKPVLIMTIDLEEMTEIASSDSPYFTEDLLNVLPQLNAHHCSPGYPGGFVERLKKGTYFAHIIEHIALELSEAAGIGVNFGKAIYDGKVGQYKVVVRFTSEEGMKFLLESAMNIAGSVWRKEKVDLDELISKARSIVRRTALGPSTEALISAAEKKMIPWRRLDEDSLIQLGYGKYRKFIQATTTSQTSDISVYIAQDKNLTKKLLQEAGIRVPEGLVISHEEDLQAAFKELGCCVAVKPCDGNHGRGVSLNITNDEELREAFRLAKLHSRDVIIEECMRGEDYRVLVVQGKVVAASHRRPAHVIGDGHHSLEALIDSENDNPLRGDGHERPMTRIMIDEEALNFLQRKGLTLDYIPSHNEVVYLRETANLSTGGTAADVTDIIHPDIKFMCERAAKIVGLDVCGIDLILEDIEKPLALQDGGVIEVNAGPGIRMHLYPSHGKAREVGEAIISSLFKEKSDGRIPIVAITGTNGKTTVTRVVSHITECAGLCVGTTTTDGIYIGKKLVYEGDNTGPISARSVLSDPMIDIAVLETARGGIVKRGLGFDWCDVGVITNIQPDHIGQDGIEGLDDILWVKSLVIERVRPGGTIVLNADSNELMKYLEENPRLLEDRSLTLFSMNSSSSLVQEHIKKGGMAIFYAEGSLYLSEEGNSQKLIDVKDIPLTLSGTALFHIENAMASIASALGAGISLEAIIKGLRSFTAKDNPGRTEVYRIGKGFLLLDYGHNPDAFLSIGEMARKWGPSKITGVVGTPGDRSDSMIGLAGTAAAHAFDKIIIREDQDLRDRKPGEVANLLKEAIMKENTLPPMAVIHDPYKALHEAIREMEDDELVIYFYEERERIIEELQEYNPTPLDLTPFYREGEVLTSLGG